MNQHKCNLKGIEGGSDISPVARYPLNRSPIRSTNAPQMSIPNNATYKIQSTRDKGYIGSYTILHVWIQVQLFHKSYF